MKTKQLLVAAALMILATACKETGSVQPLNTTFVSDSPGQSAPKLIENDSTYDSQSNLIKVKGKPKPQ